MDANYCESFLSYLLCSNKLFLSLFPFRCHRLCNDFGQNPVSPGLWIGTHPSCTLINIFKEINQDKRTSEASNK